MLDRWRVVIRGQSSESTATKRGAEKAAEQVRGHGLPARVERTRRCPACRLHGCTSGECPDQ